MTADLVIADLSESNPNIYYELGIVHALGTPLIVISRTQEHIPFDLRNLPILFYKSINALAKELKKRIPEVETHRQSVSPVLQAVPSLDRVPRSDLIDLERRLDAVTTELKDKDNEIKLLRASPKQAADWSLIRQDITDSLQKITEDVITRQTEKLVSIAFELEKLKAENESLRHAEYEIRKREGMMLVNPRWSGRRFEIERDSCFLLMPFREPWSDDVWKLIDGIVTKCGLCCKRADEQDGRTVMDDIWEGICKARVVIADLTAKNPNVTYEVGLADVLGKDVIILSQNPNDVPFDFLGQRLITYQNSIGGVQKLTEELHKRLSKFKVFGESLTSPSH